MVLPADATERYKFQRLTDHLKCEESSLVADSYSNSRQPYTDTVLALTKMYGQPHKLAVQRIGELMDGPNIHHGDVKDRRLFGLQAHSLVGMLEQLGTRGHGELQCVKTAGQATVPHDLTASFKRFIYPRRVVIPSLIDFAESLEYEFEVQEDSVKYVRERKKDKRDLKQTNKTTTILLGHRQNCRDKDPSSPAQVRAPSSQS